MGFLYFLISGGSAYRIAGAHARPRRSCCQFSAGIDPHQVSRAINFLGNGFAWPLSRTFNKEAIFFAGKDIGSAAGV
ncbi:MAG: hypothetical protein MUO85_03640 [candidate division Zixibacteria bacterium]|nr:hypothetical protein [candidate division Zixibacteria bacterium]